MSSGKPLESSEDENDGQREATPLPAQLGTAGDGVASFDVAAGSHAWRRARRVGLELVETLLLAALIFFAVRAVAQNFRVEGSSMEPGLHNGQYLLVNKAVYFKINLETLSRYIPFIEPGDHPQRFLFRAPKRGDVIVFRFPLDPSRDFIKRVIGLPGDTVQVEGCDRLRDTCTGGGVFVDGARLDEPYVADPGRYDYARQVVPNGAYFVLGDNRNSSYDSHEWGFLAEGDIIGQAMLSYWPLGDFGGVGNRSINLGFVRLPLP
jgi:signal peptidase I